MLSIYVKVYYPFFSVKELSLELMQRHGRTSTVSANEMKSKCHFKLSIVAYSFIRNMPSHMDLL